jgi:glucose/arabinose dehydrogenase
MTRRHVRAEDLPAPNATPSVSNIPEVVPRPKGAALRVPPGFTIREWAADLTNPRVLIVAPNGDVFVSESKANRVSVLRDKDGDGKAETRAVFAENLNRPFGLALYPPGPQPAYLYIANTDSVVRCPYRRGQMKAGGAPEVIVRDLPVGGHWARNLRFSPDGKKMVLSVPSQLNIGEEEERRATIQEFNPDGTGYRILASGLRNASGLDYHPQTGQLWATCNERDFLGDDLVPDFVTSIKPGGFYGYPYFYIGPNRDPRVPENAELRDKCLVPDVLLEAHVSALGMTFYTGTAFPPEYRGHAFVALHGSSNCSKRRGYSVVRVPVDKEGRAEGSYEDFVSGWVAPTGEVWGRPVDVAVSPDGAMFISDDGAGKIWRVTYIGQSGL